MSMENNLLVFGTKNFNNSLIEVKEYLHFSLIFYDNQHLSESSIKKINSILVDGEVCNDSDVLDLINKIKNKPVLLLKNKNSLNTIKLFYNDVILLPSSLIEISNKLTDLIISRKFNQNSAIKIKEYVVDKNERKLKKKTYQLLFRKKKYNLLNYYLMKKNHYLKVLF